MKILRVGDPHIKPSNVEEAEDLLHFINDQILAIQPDRVELMGDLFHTHNIVRLEVLEFWYGWLDVLTAHENIDIYVLVGNHDKGSTDELAFSAVSVFNHKGRAKNLKICEIPRVDGPFAYVSYYADHNKFIEVANNCAANGAKVLVCHQTFDGSCYENGFYAPDGIDAKKLNFDLIISGHIHTTQDIQKDGKRIIYPGTPKWDTVSDANEDKGIWLFEHDDATGAFISQKLIRTDHVVTKIVHLTWKEGEVQEPIPAGAKVSIELIGSSAWIEKEKITLKGQYPIRTKVTDKVQKKEREAGKNFPEFVAKRFKTEVDRVALLRYMKELNIV